LPLNDSDRKTEGLVEKPAPVPIVNCPSKITGEFKVVNTELPLCPDRLWGPPSLLYSGYRGSFPGAKARPGRDTDHSPPSSAEVANEQELYLLSPQAPPWRVAGLL